NAAIGAVVAIRICMVALVLIVPIDHVNGAIRPGLEIDDLRPAIVEIYQVRRVMADKTRTAALENVLVDAGAVDIVHEDLAAILGRPIVALVHEQTRVGVSTP